MNTPPAPTVKLVPVGRALKFVAYRVPASIVVPPL